MKEIICFLKIQAAYSNEFLQTHFRRLSASFSEALKTQSNIYDGFFDRIVNG